MKTALKPSEQDASDIPTRPYLSLLVNWKDEDNPKIDPDFE